MKCHYCPREATALVVTRPVCEHCKADLQYEVEREEAVEVEPEES